PRLVPGGRGVAQTRRPLRRGRARDSTGGRGQYLYPIARFVGTGKGERGADHSTGGLSRIPARPSRKRRVGAAKSGGDRVHQHGGTSKEAERPGSGLSLSGEEISRTWLDGKIHQERRRVFRSDQQRTESSHH